MPEGYGIPNWIQPPDTARQYATGLQLGIGIAQHQQQLQAQQQEAAMRAEVQTRQLEQEAAYRRQKIEMDQAYQQQSLGLRQAQLEEVQQKNALATRTAAAKFAAQQQYQARVAAGEDPGKVMLELGPSMSAGAGDFGAALRASRGPQKPIWVPENLQTGAPGHFETPSGAVHLPPRVTPEKNTAMITAAVSELKARRKSIQDQYPGKLIEKYPEAKARLNSINQRIEQLLPAVTGASETGGTAPTRQVRRNPKTGRFEIVSDVPTGTGITPPAFYGYEGEQ